ncbi:MAG: HD domain-containing protein [Chloroflexi bacterium]|nr:HD domain-containing protein [Chloroflexota bacterium]
MIRLAASHARVGMELAFPIVDASGNSVYETGTPLSADQIEKLPMYGVREIFISDPVLDDVAVEPLIPPELEAKAALALRTVLEEAGHANSVEPALIEQAVQPGHEMAESLFSRMLGEVNSAPISPSYEYEYLMPARTASLAAMLAARIGLDMDTTGQICIGALLMDVGIARINGSSSHEYEKHPVFSYTLLRGLPFVSTITASAVVQHHERLDGSGFPQGLKGESISIGARIVAVAEFYYSQISPRSDHESWTRQDAMEYIMAFGGTLFDPVVVQAFVRSVPAYPTGVLVRLTTGETGYVVDARIGQIGRPTLRMVSDENGFQFDELIEISLTDEENRNLIVEDTVDYG